MADDRDTLAESLTAGPTFPFSDGLHQTLPLAACGVYTIWKASEFLYVGVAGRGLDPAISHTKRRGLIDRLDSHWPGRRSGDQFAVYIFDRLIVPNLTEEQRLELGSGKLSGDALTRSFIRQHLSYRFVLTGSLSEALAIETQLAKGESSAGRPLLNPRRARAGAPAGAIKHEPDSGA